MQGVLPPLPPTPSLIELHPATYKGTKEGTKEGTKVWIVLRLVASSKT